MLPKADLHIHTSCSDGRMTPEQAVQAAKNCNLAALSITDHDSIEGYFQGKEVADTLGIELIPGVEITASMNDKEVHILAYYFNPDSESLNQLLLSQRVGRRRRIKGILETLKKFGINIDYEEVRAEANGANIGRPHLAQILIKKGYVGNYFEAFARYLSTEQLGEIKHTYPDYNAVIEDIKSSGGAAVLAHPGKMYSQKNIESFIIAGIDGIECIHPSHNFELQKKYSEIAEAHSLLLTGGSDYHGGIDRADVHLGVVSVAMKHVSKMKRMTDQRKLIIETT